MNDASQVPWPELPTAAWRETYATLHLWTQIIGKIRLARTPWLNHSWHVALYVTARGLTTSPIQDGVRTFQIDLDFIDHLLRVSTSDGAQRQFALAGQSVASFYAAIMPLTIPMQCGAFCRSLSMSTGCSSNSALAFSARRVRCIFSGAASISR